MRGPARGSMARVLGLVVALGLFLGAASPTRAEGDAHELVERSARVFAQLRAGRDAGIPISMMRRARCVAVLPNVVKGALLIGARYGTGVITCRRESHEWSPLAFIRLGGPSFGLQFGVESTDLALFFRSEKGVRALLRTRVTLGADVSVAAGPIGRHASAEVDGRFTADILSYAHTRGAFLGVAFDGGYLGEDVDLGRRYYGQRYDAVDLLFGNAVIVAPAHSRRFLALLP